MTVSISLPLLTFDAKIKVLICIDLAVGQTLQVGAVLTYQQLQVYPRVAHIIPAVIAG